MHRECRERFLRNRLQRKPLVGDPGMYPGMCVTIMPWCMSGSLTHAGRKLLLAFPAHAQPAILRIWQEAHSLPVSDYPYLDTNTWAWCQTSGTFDGFDLFFSLVYSIWVWHIRGVGELCEYSYYMQMHHQDFTHICNLSLTEGVFPHQLKIANDIPIYKSDHVVVQPLKTCIPVMYFVKGFWEDYVWQTPELSRNIQNSLW